MLFIFVEAIFGKNEDKMKCRNRIYKEGALHHLYLKAIGGEVLFYRVEDYLVYFTLFCVLARKYKLTVEALCIMFNHTHSALKAATKEIFRSFCRDLQSGFTKLQNEEYRRTGPRMMKSGYAPKTSSKAARSNIIYIANNAVEGLLCGHAIEYKWNFLAYYANDHPFSEKLVKRHCRFRMRKSLSMVDRAAKQGSFLNYSLLAGIFEGLTPDEKLQMTDYIVVKYNVIDYEAMISRFGSFEKALSAFDLTTKGENDISEEWEDYSIYKVILGEVLKKGIRGRDFGFESIDSLRLQRLVAASSRKVAGHNKHIIRFFHLHPERKRDL